MMLVVLPGLGYGGTENLRADRALVYVVDIFDARSTRPGGTS